MPVLRGEIRDPRRGRQSDMSKPRQRPSRLRLEPADMPGNDPNRGLGRTVECRLEATPSCVATGDGKRDGNARGERSRSIEDSRPRRSGRATSYDDSGQSFPQCARCKKPSVMLIAADGYFEFFCVRCACPLLEKLLRIPSYPASKSKVEMHVYPF